MSSASSKNNSLEPEYGDPYELLSLEQSATESEINKAFRQVSKQLHPDKQHGKSDREKEIIAKRYHFIQEARNFLLDPKLRQPYDIQRGSRRRRQQQDKAREESMGARRRKMKEELAQKEASLNETSRQQRDGANKQRREQQTEADLIDKLRKDGKRKREEYAEKAAEKVMKRQRKQQKQEKQGIKKRQVRLKWSRKRIAVSPSEHSLAELFSSKFGKVVEVEMLGKEGNKALVTFESATSCQPCVNFYATHKEMRATFVEKNDDEPDAEEVEEPVLSTNLGRDGENVQDRQRRQAFEREQLIREMEQEENGGGPGRKDSMPEESPQQPQSRSVDPFPLNFPQCDETEGMDPFDKLQFYEQKIFASLGVSKEILEELKM
jgi:DnaJ family protein C protein 17